MRPKLLTPIGLVFVGLILSTQSFAAIDPDTVVGIWLFEGNANDSSKNGNDGELMKGADFVNEAKIQNQSLSLDGDNDYVLVPTSKSLESTADEFTGAAWIKYKRKGGVAPGGCCADDQMVLAFSTGWHNILNVFGRGGRAIPGAVEVGSAELAPSWLSGPTAVDDDEWHHIAFTYDGKTKIIYVDGEVDVEAPTGGSFGVFGIDLFIGGTPTERPGNGLIDEAGIFNVPLDQKDIQLIMKDGLGKATGLAPVSPKDRLTTMWAEIKSQR